MFNNTFSSKIPWMLYGVYLAGFIVYTFIPAERNASNMQYFLILHGLHALIGLALMRNATTFLTLPRLFSLFLLSRIAISFMYPWLSDDVFGYLFYGKATLAGENLYAIKAEDPALLYLRDDAYALMAFKQYENIYPPIATIFMTISAWCSSLFPYSLQISLLIWKAVLFSAEFLGLSLLYKWLKKQKASLMPILLYLALPMTAIEGIGQAHNEVLLIPFLIGAIMLYQQENMSFLRALMIGFFCGTLGLLKVYPIVIIIPFLLLSRTKTAFMGIGLGTIFITIAASAPWFWGIVIGNYAAIQGYMSVLQFYQGTYFNGVILYGIREILSLMNVYEWWLLAPKVLTIVRGISILFMSVLVYIKKKTLIEASYYILLTTVLISAKVHPWYFIPLIILGAIMQKQSFMIIPTLMMFTYAMYAVEPAYESMLFETGIWIISGFILFLEQRNSFNILNRNQSKVLA